MDGIEDELMTLSEIGGDNNSVIKDESFLGLSSLDINEGSTARNRGTSPHIQQMKDKGILIHGLQQLFK